MKTDFYHLTLLPATLTLFAEPGPVNSTNSPDLSDEMKTFYAKNIIANATPKLVHAQFGQKTSVPKNNGKVIEWRRFKKYPKATTPITDGVTPPGQKIVVTKVTGFVHQYGDYTVITDVVMLTTYDKTLTQVTKLHGAQAGETLDTIVREQINAGMNVQFADEKVQARYDLVGGEGSGNHYLNVDAIRRAVRSLKVANANPFDRYFVAIIHPDTAYDLKNDPKWEDIKTYDSKDWYEGEIGRIEGVRFVETTEAKIFHAANLTEAKRNLSVKTAVTNAKVLPVSEVITATEASALGGRKILIGGEQYEIEGVDPAGAGAATITLTEPVAAGANTPIYPGEAGAKGVDIYSTLVVGENAYGVLDIEGGGLQHIFKPLGSGGTSDPLNQRASTGWKAFESAKILSDEYIRRIETASTFQSGAN